MATELGHADMYPRFCRLGLAHGPRRSVLKLHGCSWRCALQDPWMSRCRVTVHHKLRSRASSDTLLAFRPVDLRSHDRGHDSSGQRPLLRQRRPAHDWESESPYREAGARLDADTPYCQRNFECRDGLGASCTALWSASLPWLFRWPPRPLGRRKRHGQAYLTPVRGSWMKLPLDIWKDAQDRRVDVQVARST